MSVDCISKTGRAGRPEGTVVIEPVSNNGAPTGEFVFEAACPVHGRYRFVSQHPGGGVCRKCLARPKSAKRSYCVAHLVHRSGGRYEVSPIPSTKLRAMDDLQVPYVYLNTKDPDEASRRVLFGWTVDSEVASKVKGLVAGEKWVCIDGKVRQKDGAGLYMFKAGDLRSPKTAAELRSRLGVVIDAKDRSSRIKAAKYFNGFDAPAMGAVNGCVIGDRDDCTIKLDNGFKGRVVFVDVPAELEHVVDGHMRWHPELAHAITGLQLEDGEGVKGRATFPWEHDKGFAEIDSRLGVAAVFYCGKKQLKSVAGRCRIGVLDQIHAPARLRMDPLQFMHHNLPKFFESGSLSMMKEFREAMANEEAMRKLVKPIAESDGVLESRACGNEVWTLVQWFEAGLSLVGCPFTRRRLWRFFEKRLLNVAEQRVMMPPSYFYRGLMPDRAIFGPLGQIDLDAAVLKSDEVYVPGREFEGLMAILRQPGLHRSEQLVAEATKRMSLDPAYIKIDPEKAVFLYMAVSCIQKWQPRLNGFDFDDFGWCSEDQEFVEHLMSRPEHPAFVWKQKMQEMCGDEEKVVVAPDAYDVAMARTEEDDHQAVLLEMIQHTLRQRGAVSLGSISNAIEADNAAVEAGLKPSFDLGYTAVHGDDYIDASVNVSKNASFNKQLCDDEFLYFKTETKALPEFLKPRMESMFRGMIERGERGGIEWVPTHYDESIARVKEWMGRFKADMRKEEGRMLTEWLRTDPVAQKLFAVESTREQLATIRGLKVWWHRYFAERMETWRDLLAKEESAQHDSGWVVPFHVQKEVHEQAGVYAFIDADRELYARVSQMPDILAIWAAGLRDVWINVSHNTEDAFAVHDGMYGGNLCVGLTIRVMQELASPTGLIPMASEQIVIGTVAEGSKPNPDTVERPSSVARVRVVDGWVARKVSEDDKRLCAWLSFAGEEVYVRDGEFNGKALKEVILVADGTHFGWIPRTDEVLLDGRDRGVLVVDADSKFQLRLRFDRRVVVPEAVDVKEEGSQEPSPEPELPVAASEVQIPRFSGVVVNGWSSKLGALGADEELARWSSQGGREVQMELYDAFMPDTRRMERCVKVLLEGKVYGHLKRADVGPFRSVFEGGKAVGVLEKGSALTMHVRVL